MGAGHGIGIKRNDYHRRNRKRNISMHKHSHGRNVPVDSSLALEKAAIVPIEIPHFDREALIDRAIRASEDQKLKSGATDVKYRCSTEKACVNYLRHACSPYETVTRGWRAGESLHLLISRRVLDAIARSYPWLADECRLQFEERNRGMIDVGNGVRVMRKSVRIARRYMTGTLTSRQVVELNERNDKLFAGTPEDERPGYIGEDDGTFRDPALSSLASLRLLYQPPFLKREEIIARRFTDQYGEMNDRWWEWEEEKQLAVPEREQQFRWGA